MLRPTSRPGRSLILLLGCLVAAGAAVTVGACAGPGRGAAALPAGSPRADLEIELSTSFPPGLQVRQLRVRLVGPGGPGQPRFERQIDVRSMARAERATGGLRVLREPVPAGPLRLELEALVVSWPTAGRFFNAVQLTVPGTHALALAVGENRLVEAELVLDGKLTWSLQRRMGWRFRDVAVSR